MKLYDTRTAQKQELAPAGPVVKMYVCGVTPYSPSHVGHAMSYVYFDVLRRYLEHRGYHVRHVQNFTDIDDKIIQRAKEQGVSTTELAQRYIDEYFLNMDRLGIKRASVYPRATEEVPQMLELISGLIAKGYAYASGGDVYFRVTRLPTYGELSHRRLDDMMAGARVVPGLKKEHPGDFVLWKGSKPGEPFWDSPWGPGRPGWHIECSAMSLRYLGEQLDIHGGGHDLVFPHHENEIAQSEAYTGVAPFARFWLHNGLLTMGQEKMSKSLGNLVSCKDALDRFGPEALRLFFLSGHYRAPLAYSAEAIEAQQRALERLRGALRPTDGAGDGDGPSRERVDPEPFRQRFTAAMDDDLNTPQALAALFDLTREIYRARESGRDVAPAKAALSEMAGVLGLDLRAEQQDASAQPFVELLVQLRGELRVAKQFALADTVRVRLQELGVSLEDSPQGTRWRYLRPNVP
ncbi:MAG: cysteine--tRNA ligase [Dehalococcoidia bacterium]|nr:cysteine--tRNA ligase [Dehalococcoidia bacterium]